MLFPLRTDRFPKRRPIVTETLIVLNLGVYLAGLIGQQFGAFDLERLVEWGHFNPRDFKWWQLFTALFLHDPRSIWHVAFNMLALWVFGPPVEGRLRPLGFLGFYLLAGAVANIAHMMVSPAPVIGASGAVAGVTGLFLALFPRSNIVCFYLLSGGMIVVSSLWFIGLYFAINVLSQISATLGGPNTRIAYMAHIAGYVYGFAVGFVLLGLKVIPREECDVFYLFKQWRRRAALRAANQGTAAGAWESAAADTGTRLKERTRGRNELDAEEARVAQARAEIHRLIAARDLAGAATKYRTLLRESPDVVLSEQRQLDIANQFAHEQDHAFAARAYELLLAHFPNAHSADEVRLLLGMLYARNLQRPQRARELISAAKAKIRDVTQLRLADQLLAELPA